MIDMPMIVKLQNIILLLLSITVLIMRKIISKTSFINQNHFLHGRRAHKVLFFLRMNVLERAVVSENVLRFKTYGLIVYKLCAFRDLCLEGDEFTFSNRQSCAGMTTKLVRKLICHPGVWFLLYIGSPKNRPEGTFLESSNLSCIKRIMCLDSPLFRTHELTTAKHKTIADS